MQNKTAFVICVIAGLLLISVAATGSIGFLEYISLIAAIPELAFLEPVVNVILYVLVAIAGLGGLGVIIGGYLLTTDRVGTGKFVIGIAAGMGLIGLIIQLASMAYLYGAAQLISFVSAVSQSAGWLGVVLSIVGRRMAKRPE